MAGRPQRIETGTGLKGEDQQDRKQEEEEHGTAEPHGFSRSSNATLNGLIDRKAASLSMSG